MRRVLRTGGHLIAYTNVLHGPVDPVETATIHQPLGNVVANLVESDLEAAFRDAGFQISTKYVVGTQWREHLEQHNQAVSVTRSASVGPPPPAPGPHHRTLRARRIPDCRSEPPMGATSIPRPIHTSDLRPRTRFVRRPSCGTHPGSRPVCGTQAVDRLPAHTCRKGTSSGTGKKAGSASSGRRAGKVDEPSGCAAEAARVDVERCKRLARSRRTATRSPLPGPQRSPAQRPRHPSLALMSGPGFGVDQERVVPTIPGDVNKPDELTDFGSGGHPSQRVFSYAIPPTTSGSPQ